MASGERFNRHAFTLASRGLPMQTLVRITNLRNGRSAMGRVNDRGPYSHGAIVDLSEALARRVCDGPKRDEASRIAAVYRVLFGRPPSREELRLGLAFLQAGQGDAWPHYAQALLNSNEFLFVN